ncbi:dihydrofolate reductase family protein [Desulfotalea psychrophila]|nr:dihydrofolate reductase family protein [Desulfotalea psychrophila]
MANIVFIGVSLDGYIADKDGGLEFLQCIPNPEHDELGFPEFMASIDALLMGRNTYETILSFGGEWPYSKPVFVLSNSLTSLPEHLKGKGELIISGSVEEVTQQLNQQGFTNLYIDGGKLIQSFLKLDMIDELVISKIPILLGGGTSLFGDLQSHLMFEHVSTEVLLNAIVQSHYKRIR